MLNSYLAHATKIAQKITNSQTVILQSGGTRYQTEPIISSLVLLLLDSHYRTLAGFASLIDKEWIAFSCVIPPS